MREFNVDIEMFKKKFDEEYDFCIKIEIKLQVLMKQ